MKMRYNDEQLKMAEHIIKTIKENGSCMDKNELLFDLQEMCGYSDLPDIVLRFLLDDGIIEYCGTRLVKLTNKGCEVAEVGLLRYQTKMKNKLTFKERFALAKDIVGFVAAITAILGFLIGLIV